MTIETKRALRCLACGCSAAEPTNTRKDGMLMLRCLECSSIYLESIPVNVAALYADNYFALNSSDAERNQSDRIGYEGSYESTYLNTEFYWAYRLSDFIAQTIQGSDRTKRCLDIGAATGRLLNVFKALGYETHGIEFSGPARFLSENRGHTMYDQPVGLLSELTDKFSVITALEVIEHLEDLPSFFADVHHMLASDGVFMGYFPSADSRWFGASADYHWLHNSFEHLVYPSEEGIRRALGKYFGRNIFTTTFMTVQGQDVIPNTIVIAIKAHAHVTHRTDVAELFRQLRYLTDPEFIHQSIGPAALRAGWVATVESQQHENPVNFPFVVALLCSKFGIFEVPQFLMQHGFLTENLTVNQIIDLLAMAQHLGGIHFMRDLLLAASQRDLPCVLKQEFQRSVDEYHLLNSHTTAH